MSGEDHNHPSPKKEIHELTKKFTVKFVDPPILNSNNENLTEENNSKQSNVGYSLRKSVTNNIEFKKEIIDKSEY